VPAASRQLRLLLLLRFSLFAFIAGCMNWAFELGNKQQEVDTAASSG
jgi:hypothetical protein